MEKIVVEEISSPVPGVDNKVETPVAPHDAPPQSEIQSVGTVDKVEALVALHDVPPKTEMQRDISGKVAREECDLWANAIASGDHVKLMELLVKDRSYLWKFEKKGRTALTIAVEEGNEGFAEKILNILFEVQEKKTYYFFRLLNPASDFDSVADYIEMSEGNSKVSFDNLPLIQNIRRVIEKTGYTSALEQRDWVMLLKMLETREFLDISVNYQETHEGGRPTILHVAAMHGCFPLVDKLLNKLTSEAETRTFGKNVVLNFIRAVDPETQLTALQMADDIIGNRSISELIKHAVRVLESFGNKIVDFDVNRSEGFFEAYPHTQWYKLLKNYAEQGERGRRVDSEMLRHSLNQNSRLLLEAYRGFSALHVAIANGEKELVHVIKALFGCGEEIVWGDRYYPRALSWDQMCNGKGLDGVQLNLNKFYETELNLLPHNTFSAREMEDRYSRSFLNESFEVTGTMKPLLPEHSPIFATMNNDIDQEWNVNREEWQKGFEADVDFNFEAEPRKSLLRVHHACKDPLQFQEFLRSVSEHENFNHFSTRMHDAKGRTMHHILLDHYTTDTLPGWAFTEIFSPEVSKFCINHAQDARGIRLIDVLIVKNFLQHNVTLRPYSYFNMKFEHDDVEKDDYSLFFGRYYIASASHQTMIATQPIWFEVLQAHLAMLKTSKLLLFVTAASTNQTILHALTRIEPPVDLMVQDKKKRTLLHYAADHSLKSETLLDMASDLERSLICNCFSTVQDYCEFRKILSSKNGTGIDSNDQRSWANDERDDFIQNEEIVQSNVRRRACILMLLQAGLDLSQQDHDRKVPSIGTTSDAGFQTWWYDMVVKNATDNKNSFNQAGNALSVVGTLVAATSYIGPLQPPMSYTEGLVRHGEKLVEVFMVTNTLAFFLAMASVMFAVVPSLPMPRESVMSELGRARQMVSVSLCLLLVAIGAIIVSFSAASVVVSQYEHSFPRSNVLICPILVGWSICLIALTSFFIRILRLSFYENPVVQMIYQFRLRKCCNRALKSYLSVLLQDLKYLCDIFCDILLPTIGFIVSVNLHRYLNDMIFVLALVLFFIFFLLFFIFFLLFFPIYHVLHITVFIPCRKLVVHCARFRRRH